jgi:pimeloyl-ACP methyl ester carboxylesterase
MDRLGPLLARTIATRGEAFLKSAYHDPSLVTEEIMVGYKRPLQVENWDQALWAFTKASRPLGLDQKVEQISVPTLVIMGDDDRIVPTEDSLRLAKEIPGARLVVIEACGHLPQEECPGEFLDAVGAFGESLP